MSKPLDPNTLRYCAEAIELWRKGEFPCRLGQLAERWEQEAHRIANNQKKEQTVLKRLADLITQLASELNELKQRVAALEGAEDDEGGAH